MGVGVSGLLVHKAEAADVRSTNAKALFEEALHLQEGIVTYVDIGANPELTAKEETVRSE